MKFVFLGYDMMLPIAERLIADGHEMLGLMSFPCDQVFNFNHYSQTLARNVGASYIESPCTDTHLDSFIHQGAEVFISAGYLHKIPTIEEERAYGINVHPSVLPHARGIMPVPYIIQSGNDDAAGYSIHKLADQFDAGDIIFQEHIQLRPTETVESYCAQILTKAPKRISQIMEDPANAWVNAKPQNEELAQDCPTPSAEMRTLDWSQNTSDILKTARAFGRYGCLAMIADRLFSVFACDGWEEDHTYPPGTCLTLQNNLAILTTNNGYIVLKEFREE